MNKKQICKDIQNLFPRFRYSLFCGRRTSIKAVNNKQVNNEMNYLSSSRSNAFLLYEDLAFFTGVDGIALR